MHQAQIGGTVAVSLWLSGQSLGSCGEWLQEDRSSEQLQSPLKMSWFSFIFLLASGWLHLLANFPNNQTQTYQFAPWVFSPRNHGACKWGIIRVGQQGLSSLFWRLCFTFQWPGPDTSHSLLIHHCRLLIAPTASPYYSNWLKLRDRKGKKADRKWEWQ